MSRLLYRKQRTARLKIMFWMHFVHSPTTTAASCEFLWEAISDLHRDKKRSLAGKIYLWAVRSLIRRSVPQLPTKILIFSTDINLLAFSLLLEINSKNSNFFFEERRKYERYRQRISICANPVPVTDSNY